MKPQIPPDSRLARLGEFAAGARVVFGRELEAYFDSPIAYIVAGVFLVLTSSIFMNGFFLTGVVDMGPWFSVLPYLLIPFVASLTMRSWAEEKAQHTLELLMTLPLDSMAVVLGKYLAALAFYLLVLAGSLPIVVMLLSLGGPDLGGVAASYVGAAFLGAFFLAFGMFASGLTGDQIVAFVLASLIGFFFVLSGHPKVVEVLDGLWPAHQFGTWAYESLSVMPHYESFTRGVVSLLDTAYFAAMSAFFVLMNELTLRRSKY
jgi:ABC-2 type transport system permease protein